MGSISPEVIVYARHLLGLQQGYPLWNPEAGEVEIGDVGFLKDGTFHRMFNVTYGSFDPTCGEFGVPEGFAPFAISASGRRRTHAAIKTGVLSSSSLSLKGIAVDAPATA